MKRNIAISLESLEHASLEVFEHAPLEAKAHCRGRHLRQFDRKQLISLRPGGCRRAWPGIRPRISDTSDRLCRLPSLGSAFTGRGLTPADRIINSPPDSLANGDLVRVAQ
jgi:hypothetical protein